MDQYVIYLLLFLAAVVGGAVNAFAGGGGFIVFPSLVLSGVSSIRANAMTCVSLWTGNIISAKAFQNDLRIDRKDLTYLLLVSAVGGLSGAVLMVITNPQIFQSIVPYFHLVSWLMFTFSKTIMRLLNKNKIESRHFRFSASKVLPLFLVNLYGGYFSAGIGIMVLSLFSLYGMKNLNEMNGLKTLLVSVNNGIAAVCFIFSGLVDLKITLLLSLGALIGGYCGARISRRLNPELIRKAIILIGGLIAVYFFSGIK